MQMKIHEKEIWTYLLKYTVITFSLSCLPQEGRGEPLLDSQQMLTLRITVMYGSAKCM